MTPRLLGWSVRSGGLVYTGESSAQRYAGFGVLLTVDTACSEGECHQARFADVAVTVGANAVRPVTRLQSAQSLGGRGQFECQNSGPCGDGREVRFVADVVGNISNRATVASALPDSALDTLELPPGVVDDAGQHGTQPQDVVQ